VELYPGLVVEDTKAALVPGSGLCATFTLSRAILADAVALVRGDRHCTLDYTPWNLTNWGYEEANHDVAVDGGHVFYKLFLRAFPHHFEYNSVYAHFPLVTPSENKEILSSLGLEDKYSWKKPGRLLMPSMIFSHAACKTILENKRDFKVTWGKTIQFLMQRDGKPYGKDFMLAGDGTRNENSRKMLTSALYIGCWRDEVSKFYKETTLELLRSRSYKVAGVNQVDIVRDVLNIAQVRFCAKLFSLPLKSEENPHGIYTDAELYMVMAIVFTCIFYNVDPVKSFRLREAARKLTQDLGELVTLGVRAMSGGGLLGSVLDKLRGKKDDGLLPSYGVYMMQRLLKSGLPPDEVIWTHMLPTAGGMVANQGQLISQCLDYYLSEEGAEHLPRIQLLAQLDTPECDEVLKR
jgi:linoleate 8R-lipoxygenase/9,12-octadecadienoate 8-hydroperoxide 8R-isomerase